MSNIAITRVLTLTAFLALLLTPAKVTRPSGTPIAKVPVYLIRNQRTTLSGTTTDANGIARICDAPLKAVDIGVGFDVCGSVLVRNVKATWPEVRQVFVTYVETPCDHFLFGDRCQVLLRVQDEAGRPVVGARFDGRPSAVSGSEVSDEFGRVFRSIKRGEKVEGLVIKEGRAPARISEPCLLRGEHDLELKVFLRTP